MASLLQFLSLRDADVKQAPIDNPTAEQENNPAFPPIIDDIWIKDIAVQLALDDVKADAATGHIERIFQAKLKETDKVYESKIHCLDFEIDNLKQQLLSTQKDLDTLQLTYDQILKTKDILRTNLENVDIAKAAIKQAIYEKRILSEKKFFDLESKQLKDEENNTYDGIIKGIDQRVKVAEKLFEIEKLRWSANKPEYNRIVEDFEKEKKQVEEEKRDIETRLKVMRFFGVTKTTSGFLVWAGYFSLAAISSVVGLLISGSQKNSSSSDHSIISDQLKEMINMIISGVGNLIHSPLNWESIKAYGVKVGLILAVCSLIITFVMISTVAIDSLLKRFDNKWAKKNKNIPIDHRNSGKLGSAILANLNRELYKNILAAGPVALVAIIVIIFLSLVGVEPLPAAAAEKTGDIVTLKSSWAGGLTSTYYGMAVTLLTISGALLYAQRFIEPRWLKYINHEYPPDLGKTLSGHQEFLVIIGLLIIALLTCAILPSGPAFNRVSLFTIALFMCAMSLGMAYGLIYRGLFRDLDYLDGKRQGYRALIDEYSAIPTQVDFYEEAIPTEEDTLLREYKKSRHKLNELRMLNELRLCFSDDNLDSWRLLKPISSKEIWRHPSISLNNYFFPLLLRIVTKKKNVNNTESISYKDAEVAPTESKYLAMQVEQERHLMDRGKDLDQELTNKKEEINRVNAKIVDLQKNVSDKELQKKNLSVDHEQSRSKYQAELELILLSFKASHSLGVLYKKLFLSK